MFPKLYHHKKQLELTKAAIQILEILNMDGDLQIKELKHKLNVSKRTVHYGLKNLLAKDVVKKVPNLQDLRLSTYRIDRGNLERLQFQTRMLMYQELMHRIR